MVEGSGTAAVPGVVTVSELTRYYSPMSLLLMNTKSIAAVGVVGLEGVPQIRESI